MYRLIFDSHKTFHHTVAIHMLDNGMNIVQMSKILVHDSGDYDAVPCYLKKINQEGYLVTKA